MYVSAPPPNQDSETPHNKWEREREWNVNQIQKRVVRIRMKKRKQARKQMNNKGGANIIESQ